MGYRILPDAPYDGYARWVADAGGPLAGVLARDPEAIVAEVHRSGLRGRGGAGFPTGIKWRSVAQHPCPTRYVVCNAAEGEPGAFKDRLLLRRNPYAVLEGMRLAARAVGAREGYIALKASSAREIARVRGALDELAAAGVLDGFAVTVVEGPEEYLFGEEKALLNVIEGTGPLPRTPDSPPYEVGLFAHPGSPNPALVNNAETFAHVAAILRGGADAFRAVGTSDTHGTVLFTVCGDVARPGVYELPAGVTLRHLFHDVAGGARPGRALKAALSGVSSGIIPVEKFDTHADFGSLALLGAGLGAAGFIVFDDERSLPRVAQAILRFLYVESCNQCSSCKHGLRLASTALDELFHPGERAPDLLERALVAVQHAPQGNRCYLPVQASVLLPSMLKRFGGEFATPAPAPPFELPKIVDFDEAAHRFTFDAQQAHKLPDWTYAPASGARPTAAPAAKPSGPVAVRLDPDVAAALAARAGDEPVEAHANRALREWLGLSEPRR